MIADLCAHGSGLCPSWWVNAFSQTRKWLAYRLWTGWVYFITCII